MSLETALFKIIDNSPRLDEAWGDKPTAQFAFDHRIASYSLSVVVTSGKEGQRKTVDMQIGHFDPARSVGSLSAWQLWPALGLDQGEQTEIRMFAEEDDYDGQWHEATRVSGRRIVNMRHPRTIAMRSLARRWADNLGQQTILQKANAADIAAAKLSGGEIVVPPDSCQVDKATISYLAIEPRGGEKTDSIPPGATSFRNAFDRSLVLRLQGILCHDEGPTAPGGLAYRGRRNFSIPLVGFTTIDPQDPDSWQPTPNHTVVSEQQGPLLDTAFTTLVSEHGQDGFSAQFCGSLAAPEN